MIRGVKEYSMIRPGDSPPKSPIVNGLNAKMYGTKILTVLDASMTLRSEYIVSADSGNNESNSIFCPSPPSKPSIREIHISIFRDPRA